jgi:hypothetical protein
LKKSRYTNGTLTSPFFLRAGDENPREKMLSPFQEERNTVITRDRELS